MLAGASHDATISSEEALDLSNQPLWQPVSLSCGARQVEVVWS